MNIKELEVFRTVAKEKNLSKASKLLYMTPQGISKIIKNIESECDCELFVRTGNGMELSECGEHFAQYAKNMENQYKEMRQELLHIRQKERGVVDLLSAYGILRLVTPECIMDFKRKYPEIDFTIGNVRINRWNAGLKQEKAMWHFHWRTVMRICMIFLN